MPADLVLVDATVYTAAGDGPAEAIAVRSGAIVAVGSTRELEPLIGPHTQVVSLPGAMVLPGFVDAHVHPVTGGVEAGQCDLNEATTTAEVFARIQACDHAQSGRWLVGGGWDLTLFSNANPTAAQLDALVDDRPVYLTAADNHSAWLNTAGLRETGVTVDTPDPPGGRIERDAQGRPTGTLREAAMAIAEAQLPPTTDALRRDGLRRALAMAHRFGITSVQEANATPPVLQTYVDLAQRGELTARVVVAQHTDPSKGVAQLDALLAAREGIDVDPARLRASSIKIFADGVIEAGTAALVQPYEGTTSRGELNVDPQRLQALVLEADARGFDVHVHAIGDRAVRATLDAIAYAQEHNPPRDRRHMLAHIQLIAPDDIGRFAALGVIANVQALWAYADPYITDLTVPVLGPQRSAWLYPLRSLADSGAMLVGGSDWSVSSMNPLRAIEVALTRREPGLPPGPAWLPEQTLDLPTMLAAYTSAGAYANRHEHLVGTLEPGKRADLAILDRDLFSVEPQQLHAVGVRATLVDGELVYGALE